MLNSGEPHAGHFAPIAPLVQTFVQYGWSVIPLRGTGEQGKAPALAAWQRYQHQKATPEQVSQWLADSKYIAYGIICGTISQILILDFDERNAYQHFAQTFPELTQTLTIRTGGRGGYHLYYRIHYPVNSQKIIGGDLIAEGKYAVAPGSVINGKVWDMVSETNVPRYLNLNELEAIRRVFGIANPSSSQSVPTPSPLPMSWGGVGGGDKLDFLSLYRQRVHATGQRNNSLFFAACRMRDAGQSLDAAMATLATAHAAMPAACDHHPESQAARQREAVATIRSAYRSVSLPVAPSHDMGRGWGGDENGISRLPNALREKFLTLENGVAYLRTLEGLIACGIQSGTKLALEDICRRLEGIVGRYSIKFAVSFARDYANRAVVSPHTPQQQVDTGCYATDKKEGVQDQPPNAGLGGKNRRFGFTMPSIPELCAQFQVNATLGDPIGLEAVSSVKLYRAALHQALVQRRPGIYSRQWQAKRLGTSTRTLRTYDRESRLRRVARYAMQVITWHELKRVPARADYGASFKTNGLFLEDESGKRYPPYRELAGKLLKQGKQVMFKRQLPNYYYHGHVPPFYMSAAPLPENEDERRRYLEAYLYCVEHGLPLPTTNHQGAAETHREIGENAPSKRKAYRGFYLQNEPACSPIGAERYLDRPLPIVTSNTVTPLRVPTDSPSALATRPSSSLAPQPSALGSSLATHHSPLVTRPSSALSSQLLARPSPLAPQPSALFRKPLENRDDEAIADALTMSIPGVKLTSARWIVHSLGRKPTWGLVGQIQALQAKGRLVDAKKYLMRVVSNKLNGIDPTAKKKPTNYHRPLKEAKAEATANRIHTQIPALTLANTRKLVETYGIQAADKTLRQIQWLTNPPARTGRTPYEMRNPAGFFISAIRQAWRDLQPAQGGVFPPAPRFESVKPRKPRQKPYDPLKEFMKLAKRGNTINWGYLEWRANFHAEQGITDPFQTQIDEWRSTLPVQVF